MERILYKINVQNNWFYNIIIFNVYNFYSKLKDAGESDIIVINLCEIDIYI